MGRVSQHQGAWEPRSLGVGEPGGLEARGRIGRAIKPIGVNDGRKRRNRQFLELQGPMAGS